MICLKSAAQKYTFVCFMLIHRYSMHNVVMRRAETEEEYKIGVSASDITFLPHILSTIR